MKKSDTEKFKKLLEEELVLLEKELSGLGIKNPTNPSDWTPKMPEENISPADENEVADTIDDAQINNAIVNDLEVRYNNIKKALQKIEEGNYGKCEINNHPIDEKRLEANPSARTCKEHMNEDLQ
ncbi:hypothetical protein KKG48_01035 [Patescibacteria group bacterium]|nr:hypothetical protein [Patescibacteria group bacterium]MCG2695205.1 hypothetical protein [Candidatus Parcubacteria bacterium]